MSHHLPRKFRKLLKKLIGRKVEVQTVDGKFTGILVAVRKNYVKLEEIPIFPYVPGGTIFIQIRHIVAVRPLC
ncbi:MAG: YuzF family protein [Actinobacteria bacterium]|nr:YuzF family protein [Actinomycetota bacterium]